MDMLPGDVNADVVASRTRRSRRRLSLTALAAIVALSTAACGATDDGATSGAAVDADTPIELRDQVGPHVDAPERSMSMTVDAVDTVGNDVLVRLRVANSDDDYLDMGVQDTIYGPLLVMRDDRGNLYESLAVEPAGVPGRRIADLSFRLAGPIDPDATSFTLELATQRGPLTSPTAALPLHDGIRWRIDVPSTAVPGATDADPDPSGPVFASAPRLPDLVHFWLETEPLPE
ncbi:MAG: hypothetical protein ABJH68_18195 [Ilumatobacter sp.]|uniref:hypothetical protein n=1 Tax=Ilumatobacter sp. TaxID=1967498 RepID=UPI003299E56F